MKKAVLIFSLAMFHLLSIAQQVSISEILLNSTETGKGKLKKAPKKVFIAEFRVFYQIYYANQETQKGKFTGNMLVGDATASLLMTLTGITDKDLIENTDYLYNQTLSRIKEAGYELVEPDKMAGIKEFEGWERKKGGTLNDAQAKGFLMSTPTNFEYFVKGTKESGKEKATFTDNSAKISYQGGNVTVLKINLIVPMAENGESYISEALDIGAKVVGQTAFKISDEAVGTTFSTCSYINSEAMSLPTSMMVYKLKQPIEIDGVVKKGKVKVVGVQEISFGTGSTGLYRYFEVDNTVAKKAVPVPVDPALYNAGVRMAGDAFLKECWNIFSSGAQ